MKGKSYEVEKIDSKLKLSFASLAMSGLSTVLQNLYNKEQICLCVSIYAFELWLLKCRTNYIFVISKTRKCSTGSKKAKKRKFLILAKKKSELPGLEPTALRKAE